MIKNKITVVFMCGILIASCYGLENGAHQRSKRMRRSFLSSLWGGGETTEEEQPPPTPSYPPGPNVLRHYPIWRVHKYNGLHLNPSPISLVPDPQYVQKDPITEKLERIEKLKVLGTIINAVDPERLGNLVNLVNSGNLDNLDELVKLANTLQRPKPGSKPPSLQQPTMNPTVLTKNSQNMKPVQHNELQMLAIEFGITNVDNLPPIEDVMALLGTTSREETIEAIREYASTESGLQLIKDYLSSYAPDEPVNRMGSADTWDNNVVPQYIERQSSGKSLNGHQFVYPQIPQFKQELLKTPIKSEEPATGFFQGLRDFFSFGSTPSAEEEIVVKRIPSYITDNYINPLEVPQLPHLDGIPDIPGYQNLPSIPQLPRVYIPPHFTIPSNAAEGTYVRVKYPLNGFDPVHYGPQTFKHIPHNGYYGLENAKPFAEVSTEAPKQEPIPVKPSVEEVQVVHSEQDLPKEEQSNEEVFAAAPKLETELSLPLPYDTASRRSDEVLNPESPQRVSPFDFYATGTIHTANPNDIKLLVDADNNHAVKEETPDVVTTEADTNDDAKTTESLAPEE